MSASGVGATTYSAIGACLSPLATAANCPAEFFVSGYQLLQKKPRSMQDNLMDSQKPHDSQIQLIRKSPFVMETDDDDTSWYFEVDDARSGKTVSACIDARALLDSLGEPCGEAPLLTCGCGVAECARIYDERFECGDGYVHWSLTFEGRPYSFFFDKDAYETGALRMLSEVYRTKAGWEFCFGCFFSYEQFKSAVDGFLTAKPSFRKLWDSLNADS